MKATILLKTFKILCVWVFCLVLSCLWGYMWGIDMSRGQGSQGSLLRSLPPCLFEIGFLTGTWNSLSRLRWLARKPQQSSYLHISSAGITSTNHYAQLFYISSLNWTQVLMHVQQALYCFSYLSSPTVFFLVVLKKCLLYHVWDSVCTHVHVFKG